MNLLEFEDALQGALWHRDGRRVLIISTRKFCKETAAHPRILISGRTPSTHSPFTSIGVIIFVRPFNYERAKHFCASIGRGVRVIIWDHTFELIEQTLFKVLERNKPRGEKPIKFPPPIIVPAPPKLSPVCRNGAFYGKEFVLANADPMAENLEKDIARIHGLIPNVTGKPGIPTLRKYYYGLKRQGKLGLFFLQRIA